MVLLDGKFDKESGVYKFVRRFELKLADGEVIAEDIPSVKHFATLEEIYSWLSSAGFIVEEVYGDYNYNPIGEKTNRAIIWAKKA
jgi:hypothetical protein